LLQKSQLVKLLEDGRVVRPKLSPNCSTVFE